MTAYRAPVSPYIVASWVPTDRFYGRVKQVDRFFGTLLGTQLHSLQVFGLRGSGKTSFLRYISDRRVIEAHLPREHPSFIIAYVDLSEGIIHPAEFYRAVAEALAQAAPSAGRPELPASLPGWREFNRWLRPLRDSYHLVVLLDEFELLTMHPAFDPNFFVGLRALAAGSLMLVTASYHRIYALLKQHAGADVSSPFFNIFHPTPIYVGALSSEEAQALIACPAAGAGVQFSPEDVTAIQDMAGGLPYFIQVVTDKWLSIRAHDPGLPAAQVQAEVLDQILVAYSPIHELFTYYWESLLTGPQRASLEWAARDEPGPRPHPDEEGNLLKLGLLTEGQDQPVVAGLFRKWILDHRSSPGVPPDLSSKIQPDGLLVVTATKTEAQAVLEVFSEAAGKKWTRHASRNKIYYALGTHCGAPVYMVQCEAGTATPGGALLTVRQAIQDLRPQAVIMCGIAFGLRPEKQELGDILVAKQIQYYEPQKVDSRRGRLARGDRATSSERLLDRFRSGDNDWTGARTHFGLVVSGEKLVNDLAFRNRLLKAEPEAVGGEMEGAGLYAAARDAKVDWILVKAVCDWADGTKNDDAQGRAARNAAEFVLHVVQSCEWGKQAEPAS